MKQIKIFPEGSFVNGIDFSSKRQCNLYVDMIPAVFNTDDVNILLLAEPDIISGINKHLYKYDKLFNCILTHNQEIVDKYDNAVLFTFNTIWATHKDYNPKEYNISTIVGNKTWTKHQVMRQELWYLQDKIPNRKFYASSVGPPTEMFGNPSIGENKDELFKSQFHIAIENGCTNNWFSEKILDCFISKTVPIYCGCPNLGEYFDEKGIIRFANIGECVEKCNSITENTYNEMLPYVEKNYNIALGYIDWRTRVKEAVLTYYKNHIQ